MKDRLGQKSYAFTQEEDTMKVRSTFRITAPVVMSLVTAMVAGSTIYLSGPMTGLVGLNKPVFDNVAAQLRALGFIVINPSETDPIIIEGEPFHWFYFRCILGDIMDIAHKGVSYVVTLDDAGASLGARCELHTALNIGAGVIHHSDVPGVTYVPNLPKEVKVA